MRARNAVMVLAGVLALGVPVAAAEAETADLCLETTAATLEDAAWAALVAALEDAIAERSALFPAPLLADDSPPDGSARRLSVDAGHDGTPTTHASASCLEEGMGWGARFGRGFLDAGADQMLAEAPTTPGIESSVDITWLPDEDRLVTTLVFAGPLDIPNGTCWLDEVLTIDEGSGQIVTTEERGVETSPFAGGACTRFFDFLPDGGAAGQAASLLPQEFVSADGRTFALSASQVSVTEDGVVIGGSFEER